MYKRRTIILTLLFTTLVILLCPIPAISAPAINIVDWDRLSDRDISPDGKSALSIEKALWKHAETEHFVYHFTDAKEAETVYVHAEVYYNWIKDLFGIKSDRWKKKSHIFVFTDRNIWNGFLQRTGQNKGVMAFTTGWELFMYRDPYWLSPRQDLAHELTHVIIFRFLDGPLPLFLNEGFAEFVSYRALAMQLERSEYDMRTIRLIPKEEFIPLTELIEARSYPEKKMDIFYRESELFVRFLIFNYENKKFYALLFNVSKSEDMKKALEKIYGMSFKTIEEKFEAYASAKIVK